MIKAYTNNSDYFGITSSVLCMIHCFATPFLFITQAQTATIAHEIPFLWQSVNYFFLLLSFIAVYFSIKNSTKFFVKVLLFAFSFMLGFLIINEGLEGFYIQEFYTYLSASFLSLTHIYNLKYCNCKDEECCVH